MSTLLGMSLMQFVGAVFFVGFFAAAGVAILFAGNPIVRKGFLAGFFAVLVVVALVAPVQPLPMIHWHKFSHPVPQEQTQYQFRVVDDEGRELQYDVAATLKVDGAYLHRYASEFVNADPDEQREVGAHLVERANAHRNTVEDPPLTRHVRYPPGYVRERWTQEKVAPYGTFVGLRVYELTTTTTADGREVVDVEEELVVDLSYDEGTVSSSNASTDTATNASNAAATNISSAAATNAFVAPVAAGVGVDA